MIPLLFFFLLPATFSHPQQQTHSELGPGTPTKEEWVDGNGKTWLIYDLNGQKVIWFTKSDDGGGSGVVDKRDTDGDGGGKHTDSASGTYIAYGALQRQGYCNQNIYGNCVRGYVGDPETCTYYTKCRSGG
ncbi:hypothetical protein HII31_00454 [Pseudocercospora fuligena]|uniref:Uncharacterized protein n=1 Tax=Pseudocercospora fuligena TaxID=685502 RepID=A0A8H6RWE1_9PEZI|nr:hypothetical protein HII31_00454 [Pseudocercospora fuligena]